MMRVALYARYSSDNQREASIEDQFRICREQAKREKWKIVGTYKAVTANPATKSVIDAGRRKIAERVSPDPAMAELTEIEIDAGTTVLRPEVRNPQT